MLFLSSTPVIVLYIKLSFFVSLLKPRPSLCFWVGGWEKEEVAFIR